MKCVLHPRRPISNNMEKPGRNDGTKLNKTTHHGHTCKLVRQPTMHYYEFVIEHEYTVCLKGIVAHSRAHTHIHTFSHTLLSTENQIVGYLRCTYQISYSDSNDNSINIDRCSLSLSFRDTIKKHAPIQIIVTVTLAKRLFIYS